MSNTRYAEPGAALRPERFASSPARCTGLKTGDVIRRCENLTDPREIELALFLQYISDLPGGFEKLSKDILDRFPGRCGTPAMLEAGVGPSVIYSAEKVRSIRKDPPFHLGANPFRLKGEVDEESDLLSLIDPDNLLDDSPARTIAKKERSKALAEVHKERLRESQKLPATYPASAFMDICKVEFLRLVPKILTRFCIDPGFPADGFSVSDSPWSTPVFGDLRGALFDYCDSWEKETLKGLVVTEVGAKVLEALNYAEEQRCLSLVEGFARTGKTFIARKWCEARPGRRRFVSLSEATSDKEFYREIGKSVGSASSYGFKGNEMRERVNDVLRPGHLTLVIDEGHFLWPQRNLREASPRRIEWMRTSLINHGVPVAIIATHQFSKVQQKIEKNTLWSSEQLTGRVAWCAKLPNRISREDLEAIARFHLPNADQKSVKFLVDTAFISKKYLAAIDHHVMAARHEARRVGRTNVTYADLMYGFNNIVLPSDQALDAAAEAPETHTLAGRRKFMSKVFAKPLQTPSKPFSDPPLRKFGSNAVSSSLSPIKS
jgi:hypothetical protein